MPTFPGVRSKATRIIFDIPVSLLASLKFFLLIVVQVVTFVANITQIQTAALSRCREILLSLLLNNICTFWISRRQRNIGIKDPRSR